MIEFLNTALDQLGEHAALELVAIGFAIAYVILAAKQNIWCWLCAMISTALYIVLYYKVALLSESLLNVYYLLIAAYGWRYWRRHGNDQAELAVTSWRVSQHLWLIAGTAACVPLLGYWMSRLGAALPYVDAATSCFAVSATWLVTRKVLENWLYWIVIDIVGIYVNAVRGLQLTSLLFVAYVVLAVYGYVQWRRSFRQQIPLSTN